MQKVYWLNLPKFFGCVKSKISRIDRRKMMISSRSAPKLDVIGESFIV